MGTLSTVTVSCVRGCGPARPPCTGSSSDSIHPDRVGRAWGRVGEHSPPPPVIPRVEARPVPQRSPCLPVPAPASPAAPALQRPLF